MNVPNTKNTISNGARDVQAPSRSPKQPKLTQSPQQVEAQRVQLKRDAERRYSENVARKAMWAIKTYTKPQVERIIKDRLVRMGQELDLERVAILDNLREERSRVCRGMRVAIELGAVDVVSSAVNRIAQLDCIIAELQDAKYDDWREEHLDEV